MAKFPTYEEMAKEVAEKALDEFTYEDKTLREWVKIIVAQDLLAISELEKIKAEIDEPMRDTTDSYGRGYACAMFKCLDILDNHISELKGENK